MKQLVSIQCLRGVAALMVVILHASAFGFYAGQPDPSSPFALGNAGVDIFFVISGVVMWLSTCEANRSPAQFWKDRARRIIPPYWIMTAVFLALVLAEGLHPGAGDVVSSLLFIPHANSLNGQPVPLLGVGWTLNYEVVFYALFGASLLLPKRWRVLAVSLVFAALASLRVFAHGDSAFLLRTSSPLWFEFSGGLVVGSIIESRRLTSVWLGGLLAVVGCAALVTLHILAPGIPRTAAFGGPAVLIVLGVSMLEPALAAPAIWPLKRLGDSSYSLYLVHVIWIEALGLMPGVSGLPGPVKFGLAVAGAIAVGFASYTLIERRVVALLKPRAAPTGAKAAATA